MLGQYLPLLALLTLAALFAAGSFAASGLLAPRNPTEPKLSPYECGIVPSRETPERFPVRFFLVAMIFIVWGWPLVQFGLLQTSEISELPMVTIYIAWPLAGVTWILFLGENTVENIKVLRGPKE